MTRFFFNTGVIVGNNPYLARTSTVSPNGVYTIPFDCDAPKDSTLMFLCDDPNLPESRQESVRVFPVSNTTMVSKYAYFKIEGASHA